MIIMEYTENDIKEFMETVWVDGLNNNQGGMASPDMFTLWYSVRKLNPKVIVESGVWRGLTTYIIRKACPNAKIICLDVQDLLDARYRSPFYKDSSAEYHLGKSFIDFKDLDLSMYDKSSVLCFFDDHCDQCMRFTQCLEKGVKHIFLNDNYPVGCGSHYTLNHMRNGDNRNRGDTADDNIKRVLDNIKYEYVFPNVYPGVIKTGEGNFEAESFYKEENDKYPLMKADCFKYRWNTYVELL